LIVEATAVPQAADDAKEPDSQQQLQAGALAGHEVSSPSCGTAPAAPAAAKKANKPSKKRKGDLPPWGTDGLSAGIAALRDNNAQVRSLALQLLVLLPPASMQAIVALLQGLITCCEQYQQQHWHAALAVVHQLAQQRTAMVAKSCQNICKLLAQAVQGPGHITSAALSPQLPQPQQQGTSGGLVLAGQPAAGVAAAAHAPVAVDLLSELVLSTARLKASMLPAMQQQLEKQGLLQAAPLQPLLAQLEEMQQKRMAALQQQQQQQQS
jgi:hypothetical protein